MLAPKTPHNGSITDAEAEEFLASLDEAMRRHGGDHDLKADWSDELRPPGIVAPPFPHFHRWGGWSSVTDLWGKVPVRDLHLQPSPAGVLPENFSRDAFITEPLDRSEHVVFIVSEPGPPSTVATGFVVPEVTLDEQWRGRKVEAAVVRAAFTMEGDVELLEIELTTSGDHTFTVVIPEYELWHEGLEAQPWPEASLATIVIQFLATLLIDPTTDEFKTLVEDGGDRLA